MMLTKEQQIEKACTEFCEAMCVATLGIVKGDHNLTDKEKKAFSTGVLCAVDGIKSNLLPALKAIVKENPRFFENLN
jgi:hypothetical protein